MPEYTQTINLRQFKADNFQHATILLVDNGCNGCPTTAVMPTDFPAFLALLHDAKKKPATPQKGF